jgi:hypothetical protein
MQARVFFAIPQSAALHVVAGTASSVARHFAYNDAIRYERVLTGCAGPCFK